MFIELRIKQQNESFHSAAVFLQPRQSCDFLRSGSCFQLIFVPQDTRIRVIEKEWSGGKSRRLSVINPSPEGSETLTFSTDASEELDDWLDALHQHLFDQSECVSVKGAFRSRSVGGAQSKWEVEWTAGSPSIRVSLSLSLSPNQASGCTAASS